MARVIGKEQAEKVFNNYAFVNSVAEAASDGARIATVQTGALLEQTKARYERRIAKSKAGYRDYTFTDSVFVIPTEREQPGYPRSFVVFSRNDAARAGERASAVHYFVQAEAGGPWLAAAASWVNGVPPTGVGAGAEPPYTGLGIKVRDKEIAAVNVEPVAGGGVLSATGAEGRKVCERYADYMSFTAPRGERESEYFVPGAHTSEVVDLRNGEDKDADGLVRHRFDYEATGADLPVVKLADGKSLVTCAFVRKEHLVGRDATFNFKKGSDTEDLLGGKRDWSVVDTRWAVTVVFEVPEQGPADVVASNSRVGQLLSAEGTLD
ncbi:hypothetical protein [Streptomyces sp. NBC_00454]|uniref:hypothetical protein n=1 Tax=Streptomyces sp. NBC_00454 TaxID=2975747 RepID=UPI0030DF3F40